MTLRAILGLSALAATGLLAAAAVLAASSPAAGATLDAQFADFDRDYDALRNIVTNAEDDVAVSTKDGRGRSMADDIHDWILAADVQSHIDVLRRVAGLAQRGANDGGARSDLQQADQLLQAQVRRLGAIETYWRMNQMLDRHRALWQRLLDQVTEAQAADSRARIEPLERQFVQAPGPDMTVASVTSAALQLIGSYNQERGQLARSVSDQRIVAGAINPQQPRQGACPAPSQSGSGVPQPKFVPGSVSLQDYYPQAQQLARIEGRTVLKLSIDANGCMRDSALQVSSGSPALDDAAVALVQHARFLPAQRGARRVAASFAMAVRFALPQESPAVAASGTAN